MFVGNHLDAVLKDRVSRIISQFPQYAAEEEILRFAVLNGIDACSEKEIEKTRELTHRCMLELKETIDKWNSKK
jgi:hypothetical protein